MNINVEEFLQKKIKEFTEMDFFGKKVRVPYWVNRVIDLKKRKFEVGPFGGKGTPKQIKNVTLKIAKDMDFDLRKAASEEIRKFMKKNKIGIDCSGFAYQLLDFLDKEKGGSGIDGFVKGEGDDGYGVRKINADYLTNDENTIRVERAVEIQAGDLIRMHGGRHAGLIVKVSPERVVYAHSSKKTKISGPHQAEIGIVDSKTGLEKQIWKEKLVNGQLFGKLYFDPARGDAVRRLRVRS